MEKEKRIWGLLGLAVRAGKVNFGMESVKESIEKKKAKLIILATDAADRSKKIIEDISTQNKIPVKQMGNIQTLSKAIGQDNKMVVAIKDNNFAKEILKIIDGGDIIG